MPTDPLKALVPQINAAFAQIDTARIDAGRLLLEAQRLFYEQGINQTWHDWVTDNIDRSWSDIKKVMALARAANPEAALEGERAARRVSMKKSNAKKASGGTVPKKAPIGSLEPIWRWSYDWYENINDSEKRFRVNVEGFALGEHNAYTDMLAHMSLSTGKRYKLKGDDYNKFVYDVFGDGFFVCCIDDYGPTDLGLDEDLDDFLDRAKKAVEAKAPPTEKRRPYNPPKIIEPSRIQIIEPATSKAPFIRFMTALHVLGDDIQGLKDLPEDERKEIKDYMLEILGHLEDEETLDAEMAAEEPVWVLRTRLLDSRATRNSKFFDGDSGEEHLFLDEGNALAWLWAVIHSDEPYNAPHVPGEELREIIGEQSYYWGVFEEPASHFDMRCACTNDDYSIIYDDREDGLNGDREAPPPRRVPVGEPWLSDEAAFLERRKK